MCEQCQKLQLRVEELEYALGRSDDGAPWNFPVHLRPLCWQILTLLLRTDGVVSRERIFNSLYADRPECDQPEIKIVDVHVHLLRRALSSLCVEVKTAWGRGYYLSLESRRRVRAVLDDCATSRSAA